MKGEGDSAKLAVLLFLFLHNSQVLPGMRTQEEKLRQQLTTDNSRHNNRDKKSKY